MDTFRELLQASYYKKIFNEINKIFLKDKTLRQKENFDLKFLSVWQELNNLEKSEQPPHILYLVEVSGDFGDSFIDVVMLDEEEDEFYALDFLDWREIIDMRVEKPDKMSEEEALAYILWEITFWGFSNKEVSKERSKINDKPL